MNSIKIKSIRKPPENLSEKDKSLFEHEYYYEYNVKEPYIINDVTIVDDYIFTKKNILLNETNINFHNSFNNSLKTLFIKKNDINVPFGLLTVGVVAIFIG